MVKKTVIVFVSLLAIAAAVAWTYYHQPEASQRFDLSPYRARGAGVAEETARLLGKKGLVSRAMTST